MNPEMLELLDLNRLNLDVADYERLENCIDISERMAEMALSEGNIECQVAREWQFAIKLLIGLAFAHTRGITKPSRAESHIILDTAIEYCETHLFEMRKED